MSYSIMAHALMWYIESHVNDGRLDQFAGRFGFSSHEAYTRAFYKTMGMTPSQFRTKRPIIAKTELAQGVYGLELQRKKEKRSDGYR